MRRMLRSLRRGAGERGGGCGDECRGGSSDQATPCMCAQYRVGAWGQAQAQPRKRQEKEQEGRKKGSKREGKGATAFSGVSAVNKSNASNAISTAANQIGRAHV